MGLIVLRIVAVYFKPSMCLFKVTMPFSSEFVLVFPEPESHFMQAVITSISARLRLSVEEVGPYGATVIAIDKRRVK